MRGPSKIFFQIFNCVVEGLLDGRMMTLQKPCNFLDGELIEKGSPDYETAAKIMKDRESVLSSNGKYYYVPTKKGFHILNAETQKIEKRVRIEDGVDEIIEVSESNIVVFVTGGTTKLYSIVE